MAKKIKRSDIFKPSEVKDLISEVRKARKSSLDSVICLQAAEKKLLNFLSSLTSTNNG